jgi:hypothetical protein
MFHQPSSSFANNVSAIQDRLRALEHDLERIGRTAGRRTSAGMSAASNNVGEAIASAVTEIVDRFSSGRRMAGEGAARFGNEAAKFGNDSLRGIASEVKHRPLVTLAVAVGVGILIAVAAGMAGRRQ